MATRTKTKKPKKQKPQPTPSKTANDMAEDLINESLRLVTYANMLMTLAELLLAPNQDNN